MGILGKFANAVVDCATEEINRQSKYLEKARSLDDDTLLERIKRKQGDSGQWRAYIIEAKNRGLRPKD